MHGFPYDIHSYADVTPLLAANGYRVIVPYFRGYGSTTFRSGSTPRNVDQAAFALDTVALMDALAAQKLPLPPKADPPPGNGAAYRDKFTGTYGHRAFPVGHNVPQEAPRAFAQSVIDADHL